MIKENYALTYEKYFCSSDALEDFEVMEFSETFINNNPISGIVPTHVDDGEKDVSEGGVVKYAKNNVTLNGEGLSLTVTKDENGFTGAMIKNTVRKFGNGYIEIKAKFPPYSPGVWPKMSLRGEKEGVITETDFAQIMGVKGKNACSLIAHYYNGISLKTLNYLYSPSNAWPRYYPDAESPELLEDGWHIFGYEQTERDAVFYVDGIEFSRIDIDHPVFGAFGNDGELILSVSVGIPKIEAPDETTVAPCSMQVEYVKFYEEVK